MNTIDDLVKINLDIKKDIRGDLLAIEFQKNLNINIERSFLVFGKDNSIRGNHAHKNCNQFLCCINGICEIKCDDGSNTNINILDRPSTILKIPNMIWSSQKYKSKNTILLVFCDLEYSEEDYIREYKKFLEYKKHYLN
tara:strand:+ start:174 stop:590 length:417 start_codon:yes stop_codon:yes gene_type:complete